MNSRKGHSISLPGLCLLACLSMSVACSQEHKTAAVENAPKEAAVAVPATPPVADDAAPPMAAPQAAETGKDATDAVLPDLSGETAPTKPAPEPEPLTPSNTVVAIKPDGSIALQPGQTAGIANAIGVAYLRVVGDSRCPEGAQCVWAGEITIEMQMRSGNLQENFTLTDNKSSHAAMGYKIELLSIDRAGVGQFRIAKIQ